MTVCETDSPHLLDMFGCTRFVNACPSQLRGVRSIRRAKRLPFRDTDGDRFFLSLCCIVIWAATRRRRRPQNVMSSASCSWCDGGGYAQLFARSDSLDKGGRQREGRTKGSCRRFEREVKMHN